MIIGRPNPLQRTEIFSAGKKVRKDGASPGIPLGAWEGQKPGIKGIHRSGGFTHGLEPAE
jgi:hypothetical protein